MKNDTFLRALLREPTDHTPIWLMRQAGRYLPEYNATRKRAGSFLALCKNPELACEVTLQPLERYPLDAAILFSDILTVPDAMGLGLYFAEGEGPKFSNPVRDEAAVRRLAVPDPTDTLRYLIGFSGSPWTLACYMVEGGGSDDFRQVKGMLYRRPDLMHQMLTVTAHAVRDYLNAQIDAGAQAVMIFDTWGGILPDAHYQTFSLAYMRLVLQGLKREREERLPDGSLVRVRVPSIVFTKGGGLWLEDIAASGCDAVGLDWTVNLAQARTRIGASVALQGNLDPMVLMADAPRIQAEAIRTLDTYGPPQPGQGHVFNLGHGISQFTSPDSVTALCEAVHAHSRAQRRAGVAGP
jgi:uroporphyrinogen decarboxylase